MAERLFCKKLPVTLKSQDREERKTSIQIAVEVHAVTNPVHRKELLVRLTDDADLFFLYAVKIGEEDFHVLKSQQGLLVDFSTFPQKFIDLLGLVIQEQHKDVPKFILELSHGTSSTVGGASLNVVETNAFKHLTHLSLKLLPGSDTEVKKYLADCLKTLRDESQGLRVRLEQTDLDLSGQLKDARASLAMRTSELESLRSDWSTKCSSLSLEHQQELAKLRESTLQAQTSVQARHDHEKRELEQAHQNSIKELERRLAQLETSNKELTKKKKVPTATLR